MSNQFISNVSDCPNYLNDCKADCMLIEKLLFYDNLKIAK